MNDRKPTVSLKKVISCFTALAVLTASPMALFSSEAAEGSYDMHITINLAGECKEISPCDSGNYG